MEESIARRTRSGRLHADSPPPIIVDRIRSPLPSESRVGDTASVLQAPTAGPSSERDTAGEVRIRFVEKKKRNFNFVRLAENVKIGKSIFNRKYVDYLIENNKDVKNYGEFLISILPVVRDLLAKEVSEKKHVKCNMVLSVTFTNVIDVFIDYGYRTTSDLIVSEHDIEEFIAEQFARILSLIDQRDLSGGSGFRLFEIKNCEVRISQVKLLSAGSFIPLPRWLQLRKAIINVKSTGNECFKNAIFAHHCAESNQHIIRPRIRRRLENRYNFDGVRFPTPLADIKRFARQNNMTVNCYGYEKKQIYPIIVFKEQKRNHVDLLYMSRGNKTHYAWIKSLSRMLSAQVSRRHGKKHFCSRCLMVFHSLKSLNAHKLYCNEQKIAAVVLPEEDTYFQFTKFDSCQQVPLICAADFESLLVKHATCRPNPVKSFTTEVQSHVGVSFGCCLHASIDTEHVPSLPLGYFGCSHKSEKQLWRLVYNYFVRVARAAKILFRTEFPICMTAADRVRHEAATVCYACGGEFTDSNYSVMDHDHFVKNNNFRGSAHSECNLKMRRFQYVPVYFHSMSSYDLHHLMKIFCSKGLEIKILAVTLEKYMTFTTKVKNVEFRFLDSYLMLNDSLKTVSESLSPEHYVETKRAFAPELHNLIMRKAPFPYQFLDSPEKLDHCGLPDKSFFHCDLTDTPITDEEYVRAQEIWNAAGCVQFKSFMLLYNKSDTYLLLDSLLTARKLYWDHFAVDMCSYISLAHLSMQIMLKTTGVRLELISKDQPLAFDMAKRSLFGGLTMSNVRLTECGGDDSWEILFCDAIGMLFFPRTF